MYGSGSTIALYPRTEGSEQRETSFRFTRCAFASGVAEISDFKKLRAVGEIAVAACSDEDDVFQTNAAKPEIIKSGFHRHDVSGAQRRVYRCDPWCFVNIQTEAVARAVKKSLHAAGDFAGRKAPGCKQCEDFFMDFAAIDAIANEIVPDLLAG